MLKFVEKQCLKYMINKKNYMFFQIYLLLIVCLFWLSVSVINVGWVWYSSYRYVWVVIASVGIISLSISEKKNNVINNLFYYCTCPTLRAGSSKSELQK